MISIQSQSPISKILNDCLLPNARKDHCWRKIVCEWTEKSRVNDKEVLITHQCLACINLLTGDVYKNFDLNARRFFSPDEKARKISDRIFHKPYFNLYKSSKTATKVTKDAKIALIYDRKIHQRECIVKSLKERLVKFKSNNTHEDTIHGVERRITQEEAKLTKWKERREAAIKLSNFARITCKTQKSTQFPEITKFNEEKINQIKQVIDERIKNIKIFEAENVINIKKIHNEMKKLEENLLLFVAYKEIELPENQKSEVIKIIIFTSNELNNLKEKYKYKNVRFKKKIVVKGGSRLVINLNLRGEKVNGVYKKTRGNNVRTQLENKGEKFYVSCNKALFDPKKISNLITKEYIEDKKIRQALKSVLNETIEMIMARCDAKKLKHRRTLRKEIIQEFQAKVKSLSTERKDISQFEETDKKIDEQVRLGITQAKMKEWIYFDDEKPFFETPLDQECKAIKKIIKSKEARAAIKSEIKKITVT